MISDIVVNQRVAYGQALLELGAENADIVVLEADLGKSTMSSLFEEKYPDRFFEMGIAEQNMVSTAAGLSIVGKIPFLSTFAVFASGRAYDQIRQAVSIPSLNVNICGSSSGLSDFGDGATHQAVEDIALMRAIPNMTVFVPADAPETRLMVRTMAGIQGPCYIKINRNDLPILTGGARFEAGEPHVLRQGSDVAIFANGVMLSKALEAAAELESLSVSARVINVGTVKPLKAESVARLCGDCVGVVTAEEHSIVGGLGSAISECLQGRLTKPIQYVGIRDLFGTSARGYTELLDYYGLTGGAVVKAALHVMSMCG